MGPHQPLIETSVEDTLQRRYKKRHNIRGEADYCYLVNHLMPEFISSNEKKVIYVLAFM